MAENLEFRLKVIEDKLSVALDQNTQKAKGLGDTLNIALGTFAGGLAIKGFELLGRAVTSVVGVFEDSIAASSEQESALRSLQVALAQTGQLTDENVESLNSFASQLQATTSVGDETTLSIAALIQNLGRLDGEGLQRATGAAIDLSAALGVDLESAATLVGKAANGNIAAFQRYGIEIQKGKTDTETFANTLKTLEDRFGGAAAAQSKTFAGSLTQLKNAYGDVLEVIGDTVTQSPALIAVFNTLQKLVIEFGNSIKNAFAGEDPIKTFIDGALTGAKFVVDAFDGILRVVTTVFNGITTFINGALTAVSFAYSQILTGLSNIPIIGEKFKGAAEVAKNAFETFKESTIEGYKETKEALIGENLFTSISDGISSAQRSFNLFYDDVKTKAPDLKNATQISGPTLDDTQVANIEQTGREIAAIEKQLEIERSVQREQFRIAELEAQGIRREEDIILLQEFEQQKLDIELQAAIDKNNATLSAEEAKAANLKAIRDRELAGLKTAGAASVAAQKQQAANEQAILNTRLQATQGFLSAGLTLAKQGSAEAKALQTASAIVSTYTAANQALSSPPGPPFTLPLVASVIAQGLANVAKINSQSFATGGVVGSFSGASMGGDNTIANVRTGEMILNAEQQERLFEAINSGNMGGDIVIKIDEREIARAVRNQRAQGFAI